MKSVFSKFKPGPQTDADKASSSKMNYTNPKKILNPIIRMGAGIKALLGNFVSSKEAFKEVDLTKNIEEVKVEKGDKMTIIKSYDTFSKIIFEQ